MLPITIVAKMNIVAQISRVVLISENLREIDLRGGGNSRQICQQERRVLDAVVPLALGRNGCFTCL